MDPDTVPIPVPVPVSNSNHNPLLVFIIVLLSLGLMGSFALLYSLKQDLTKLEQSQLQAALVTPTSSPTPSPTPTAPIPNISIIPENDLKSYTNSLYPVFKLNYPNSWTFTEVITPSNPANLPKTVSMVLKKNNVKLEVKITGSDPIMGGNYSCYSSQELKTKSITPLGNKWFRYNTTNPYYVYKAALPGSYEWGEIWKAWSKEALTCSMQNNCVACDYRLFEETSSAIIMSSIKVTDPAFPGFYPGLLSISLTGTPDLDTQAEADTIVTSLILE